MRLKKVWLMYTRKCLPIVPVQTILCHLKLSLIKIRLESEKNRHLFVIQPLSSLAKAVKVTTLGLIENWKRRSVRDHTSSSREWPTSKIFRFACVQHPINDSIWRPLSPKAHLAAGKNVKSSSYCPRRRCN